MGSEFDTVIDEKLWRQCKAVIARVTKKPQTLPARVGVIEGLEDEDDGDADEGTVVTMVDGDLVKIKYCMNFSETTHEEREKSFATGIWIDANVPQKDWAFLLYRSAHEYRSMCQEEMSYEVAKSCAQKGERELRLNEWKDRGRGGVT